MKEIRKSFWDYITILGTSIVAIPLMVISESIQAKLLGPANYGKVALVLSAISLLYLFGMNWMRMSIMRFGKEEFIKEGHLRKTFSNFIQFTLFLFVLITLIFFLLKQPILKFLEIKHSWSFWIIILGFFLSTFKQFVFEILKVIRLIKIQAFLFRTAPKILVLVGLVLALLFYKINVNVVIAVFLLADSMIIIVGFWFIKFKYILPFTFNWPLLKKMIIFSFPLLFSSWSGYVVNWIDMYVIKYFMTLNDVGIYQAAYKIFNTFKSFSVTGLITVFTPIIMVYKTNNNSDKIKEVLLNRLLPQISFFTMIMIAAIILISDGVFAVIYGEAFSQSIIPFKILIASQNVSMLRAVYTGLITAYDKTKLLSILAISAGVINIIADIILVPVFGVVGASFASYVVFTINPVIWHFVFNRQFALKRNLALLFPAATFLILLVNISAIPIGLKLMISMMLVLISYIIGRNYNLFQKSDVNFLNNVSIPVFAKKIVKRIYAILSRN